MQRLNQLLNLTGHLERPLEYVLALLCGLLAITAVIGGGWHYAMGFAVLAITFGLPRRAWRTLSLGGLLRYIIMSLAVFSLSV